MTDELRWHSGRHSWIESRRGYSVIYEGGLRGPRGVIERIDASVAAPVVPRQDEWREDMLIPKPFRATVADYVGSGYDRGHMCASANRREDEILQSETTLLSNASPQVPGFNRGPWSSLEGHVRDLAARPGTRGVWVISLALFRPGEIIKTIGSNHVAVPHAFGKAVLTEVTGGRLSIWCVSLLNQADALPTIHDIDFVERWAGIPLFDRLHSEDKRAITKRTLWFQ